MLNGQFIFPPQSVSDKVKKTEDWQHKCIDAGISAITDKGETSLRKSRFNKLKNFNFWQFRLDKNEMRKVADPFGINPEEMPVNMKHIPLLNSKIDVLAGEELRRRTEFVVRAMSVDVMNELDEKRKDLLLQNILQLIQEEDQVNPEKIKKKLENLNSYLKYSLQDIREIKADRILQWLWRNPDFDIKTLLNRCFYDLLISAEEILCIELIGDTPTPRKCNPLNVYTLGQSDSTFIHDADIIVEDGYYSPGWVIDHYNKYLSDDIVQKIENKELDLYQNPVFSVTNWAYPSTVLNNTLIDTEIIEVDRQYGNQYGNMQGVYVARVTWKSLRKRGDLKYYDEDGMEQHKIVPEQYKVDKNRGEEVTWFWENEWWRGVRILHDIYIAVEPVPGNICPYIGVLSNVNVNRAMSLIDRGKELNMLYDIFWYRLEFLYSKYTGPIMELDLAKKPEDFTVEQWIHYAQNMGLLIVDSFREVSRGAMTGTLAGSFNTTGRILNPDIGRAISDTTQMLIYIQRAVDDITGVTPARQGNVSQIETVGGVERSVVSSTNTTEYWFHIHTKFVEKFLNTYLQMCKYAWKENPKQLRYILGDLSTVTEMVSGDELEEIDPCVYVTSSQEDIQILQLIRQAAADGVKQGSGSLSTLIDTFYSKSMHEIAFKIKEVDQLKSEQEQQKFEADQQQMNNKLQQDTFFKQEQLRIQEEDNIRKADLEYAKMNSNNFPEGEIKKEIEDPLDREKFEHQRTRDNRDLELKQKALDLKNKQLVDNKELTKEKLSVERERTKANSSKK